MRLPNMSERQSEGGPPALSRSRSGLIPPTLIRRVIPFAVGGALLLFAAAGCGGNNNTGTPPTTPTPSPTPGVPFTGRFVINWAARSRAINGLSSAQSARFTLFGASPSTTTTNPVYANIVFTVNRPADPAATSQSYTAPSAIRREWGGVLSVEFFAQADAGGTKVGTAAANANVLATAADGTVPTFGGNTDSIVSTVSVLPASLPLGASTQLLFSALDANNNILVLTPGSAFFTLANPADSSAITLTPDGIATPKEAAPAALQTISIIATVDGKASAALAVPIVSNGTLTLTPTTGSNQVVSFELPLQFIATVTGLPAGASTAVVYQVGNAAGAPDTSGNSGTITSTGLYTAPRLSGTYSVTATSVYDPSKTATTLITVRSLVEVVITPINAGDATTLDVVINNTVPLTATLKSIPAGRDAGVTWSIVTAAGAPVTDTSSGTITTAGVYTAPTVRGTYFVQAISRYDTTKKSVLKINALAGTLPVTVQ